jgi:hypothetical protein
MNNSDLNWAIRLSLDIIEPTLEEMENAYANLDFLAMSATTTMSSTDSLNFVSIKLKHLNQWLLLANELVVKDLINAWNIQGQKARDKEVRKVSYRIVAATKSLFEWEKSIASIIPDKSVQKIILHLKGTTFSLHQDLTKLFGDIRYVLDNDTIYGEMEIKQPFSVPANLMTINTLLQKFQQKNLVNAEQQPFSKENM